MAEVGFACMLPGFELNDAFVASKLDFDVIRLESDEGIQDPDSPRPPQYEVASECIDSLQLIIDEYYEEKPEIENYLRPGNTFSMRVYEEDAEVIAKKLASEMVIGFTDPIESFDHDVDIEPVPYEEFVGDSYSISLETDWSMLSDTQIDVQEEIKESIPAGIDSPSFTHECYNRFLTEFVLEPVERANWAGGHAWLINLAMRELRNGRYSSAGYAFEGARHRLTKRSNWNDNRFRLLINAALCSLRNLCMSHGEEGDPFGKISLSCKLENRDFIFYPNFVSEPAFSSPNFNFSSKSWVANMLVLVQAVAHTMEAPTISRSEVDPFGTNLTHRNVSFILKLGQALIEQDNLDRQQGVDQEPHQTLQMIDFTEYSPDIALTRILDSNGFTIAGYGPGAVEVGDQLEVDYDLLLEEGGQRYIGRTLRDSDTNTEAIDNLNTYVADTDLQILLLYDHEVPNDTIDAIDEGSSVSGFYVDLVNERMRPLSSGYPRRFQDLTTEEEIMDRLNELLQAAEDAESSNAKGDTLEELMELVFEKAIPDTEVRDVNVRTRVEEIDLQLHNKERQFPWDEMGSRILVECKNWSDTAGVDVIYTVFGKTQMMSPSCQGAILVAWEGVSDSIEGYNADQLIREIRQKDINLLVLDKEDIEQIVETGEAQAVFEDKADELWAR